MSVSHDESDQRSLATHIRYFMGALFLFQVAVMSLIALVYAIEPQAFLGFVVASLVAHLAVTTFLLVMRHDFYLKQTGAPLSRVNLANRITLFRISSMPTLVTLLVLAGEHPVTPLLVVLTVAAFFSDFVDGKVSRSTGQVTRIGQYLDSMSDYAVLIAVSVALIELDLISPWLFALVMVRLIAQGLAMWLLLMYHGSVDARATFLGKASVFATMTLYVLSLFQLFPAAAGVVRRIVSIGEYTLAGIVVVSLGEKLKLVFDGFQKPPTPPRGMHS